MNCPHCHADVRNTQVYCGSCNHPINAVPSQGGALSIEQSGNKPTEVELAILPRNVSSHPLPEPLPPVRPGPPPYQAPYIQPLMMVSPPTSGKAIASLVLGILGIVGFDIFILPGIMAVVLGHMARREIKQWPGQLGGNGLALAGLITGYIGTAFSLIFWAFYIIGLIVLAISSGAR